MTELILIMVIIVIVFGTGRLPRIAASFGKMRVNFLEGLQPKETIELAGQGADASDGRKPGKFEQPVEEAEISEENV